MIKRIIIIAVNALCLIGFAVCLSVSASIRTPLRSQQAASAWGGQSGERFSQISVFFPESSEFTEDAVRQLRSKLDDALLAASFESVPGRTLYTDAWSAETNVSIVSQRGSADAKAIAVGGDFFLFHPLYLRDGGYLIANDVMKDRVVLDEELAWRLFGASRIAGFEVIINNRPFIVAGVISRESDFASSAAYTYGAGLFMSFDALMDMTEGEATISCYEIVMPDPITGFALSTLTEGDDRDIRLINYSQPVHIVENTTRFSLGNSFTRIGSFGERSMRSDTIAFPYWENAARYAEDWVAFLLVLSLLFITLPVVFAVIYGVKIIRILIRHGKSAVLHVIEEKDRRQYEKYILEHGEDGEAAYNVNDIIREVQDEIY